MKIIITHYFAISALLKLISSLQLKSNVICTICNKEYTSECLIPASDNTMHLELTKNYDHIAHNRLVFTKFFLMDYFVHILTNLNFGASSDKKWALIKQEKPGIFLIKNIFSNEYLFASANKFANYKFFLGARRKVFSTTLNQERFFDDSVMWKLKKVGLNNYQIFNVAFNEPLYAANYWWKYDNNLITQQRNIFTWHGWPDSKQFNWNIKCLNGIRLNLN